MVAVAGRRGSLVTRAAAAAASANDASDFDINARYDSSSKRRQSMASPALSPVALNTSFRVTDSGARGGGIVLSLTGKAGKAGKAAAQPTKVTSAHGGQKIYTLGSPQRRASLVAAMGGGAASSTVSSASAGTGAGASTGAGAGSTQKPFPVVADDNMSSYVDSSSAIGDAAAPVATKVTMFKKMVNGAARLSGAVRGGGGGGGGSNSNSLVSPTGSPSKASRVKGRGGAVA